MAKRFEMTRKEMFTELVAIATEIERADLVEMLEHEIEMLDKKSSKKKETSDADKELMAEILEVLEGCEPVTCTQIVELLGRPGISTSKVRAMLTKLGDKVVNTKEGKKSVFKLA